MAIRLRCPDCNKKLQLPEQSVGRKILCPNCMLTFRLTPELAAKAKPAPVPAPVAPPPPEPEPEFIEELTEAEPEAVLEEAEAEAVLDEDVEFEAEYEEPPAKAAPKK